jgi:hypothetical protein
VKIEAVPRIRPPLYRTDAEAVSPCALPYLEDLRRRGLIHRWVRAWRSSQAFALNLFAGLPDAAATAIVASAFEIPAGQIARVATPQFEWSDPTDRLAESSAPRPHRTQVDVRLDAYTTTGKHLVVLIEVKLTETDFGSCSARANPANPARDVCAKPGLFGSEPSRCFQLSNHGHGRRRYDDYLQHAAATDVSPVHVDGGCWLRGSLSQPMRNLALADMLLAEREADRVAFGVCAPLGHAVIWRRLRELQHVFPDTAGRRTIALPAERIARLHADEGVELSERYPMPILQLGRN